MVLSLEEMKTLDLIIEDCLADTQAMEGKEMTGRVVAENFGYVRAMISSICNVIISIEGRPGVRYEFDQYAVDPETKDLAKDLSRAVNMFDPKPARDLAELVSRDHRTLQQNVMRDFVMPLLRLWAEDAGEGRYDARNEGTVKAAELMVAAFDESSISFPMI